MKGGRFSEVVEGTGPGGHLNLPALDDGTTVTLPLPVCVCSRWVRRPQVEADTIKSVGKGMEG